MTSAWHKSYDLVLGYALHVSLFIQSLEVGLNRVAGLQRNKPLLHCCLCSSWASCCRLWSCLLYTTLAAVCMTIYYYSLVL